LRLKESKLDPRERPGSVSTGPEEAQLISKPMEWLSEFAQKGSVSGFLLVLRLLSLGSKQTF
jgi:hypothetical protein